MAARTIDFVVQPEDEPELERLIEIYGGGNRSEFLREAIHTMSARDRAERLTTLGGSFADADLARWGRALSEDESAALTRLGIKGPVRGIDAARASDRFAERIRAGEQFDLEAEIDVLLKRG